MLAQRNYPVFFVTNRQEKDKNGVTDFSNERSKSLTYGELVPGKNSEDLKDSKRVIFNSEAELLNALKATGSKKVAVFVHGYRKSFDGSMSFGIDMAKNLDAPLVVFAWPSRNNYGAYMADECTAEWSSQQLSEVLGKLGNSIGQHNVIVISHSLGARMVERSMRILYSENKPRTAFGAALFFHPDVDRDTFMNDAPFLKEAFGSCKVYLDKHDSRIWLSKLLHGSPRVGSGDHNQSMTAFSEMFKYDSSLPSHHIPYDIVAASVNSLDDSIEN